MLSEMAQKGGMIMEGKTKPAFIDRAVHDSVCRDDRDWMIEHFEMRLHELMKKRARIIRIRGLRSGMKAI